MGKNYASVEMQENKLEPDKSHTAGFGMKEWVVKRRYTCTQVALGDCAVTGCMNNEYNLEV